MSALLDVNVLLAYGWKQHPSHVFCSQWLDGLENYALCPITELGFLRISMSPAFSACFQDASRVLKSIADREGVIRMPCDLAVGSIPEVSSYKDTTDAYLVRLAKHHGHRFATLDEGILNKQWATGTAFKPIAT